MRIRNVNSKIQKDQAVLVLLQSQLEEMISKINEAINEMKVEELEIRSRLPEGANLCRKITPVDSLNSLVMPSAAELRYSYMLTEQPSEHHTLHNDPCIDPEYINKQPIELNVSIPQNDESEKEDDD